MFANPFEIEEKEFHRRKTAWALGITILFHSLLLLFLFFRVLHTPIPPYPENGGGMSVNLGFDMTGTGETQPFSYSPGQSEPAPSKSAAAPERQAPENTLTEENSETNVTLPKADDKPVQKNHDKTDYKPNPKPTVNANAPAKPNAAEQTAPQPKADPNALFNKGAYGPPNQSKGDGLGGAPGDQGKPDGDPNSRNYLGDGHGVGVGNGNGDLNGNYDLSGRKKLSLPAPQTCSNRGKVVIKIQVNRAGKVINAEFERFKSTAFEPCNINNALEAARRSTFNAAPNAPEIQQGTITYIYEVH